MGTIDHHGDSLPSHCTTESIFSVVPEVKEARQTLL
jgi:hypothetical protein